ncbi:immunoglobulin-like domain-containing protein [Oerskovia flava]|uniref:immunoglobulin-like domain-containing protein n=1 Tax=Oerskovia flava TaxID=2986422 RepID=UPI0022405BA8|nr:immunoglobulin-like domain-containing protein [Oerskovia sp. JB1-3-2]
MRARTTQDRRRGSAALAGTLAGALLASVLIAAAATPVAADVGGATDDGLVAWYPLDATATTGGTTANLAEGSTFGPATVHGGLPGADGLTLDGVDDYVDLPDSLLAGLTDVTVSLDVNIATTQGTPYFIWGLGNSSGSNGNGYLFATGNPYRAAIASGNWSTEQIVTKGAGNNLPRGTWTSITYTLDGTTARIFEDGVQVGQNTNVTTDPGAIGGGSTLANYIGRSLYSADRYLAGQVRDFRLYDRALEQAEVAELAGPVADAAVEADAAALDLGDTSAVTRDLVLPQRGDQGSVIIWESSDASVVAPDGTVTRPEPGEPDAEVTLSATLTRGVATRTVDVPVTVLASFDAEQSVAWDASHVVVPNLDDVRGNVTLPTSGEYGSMLTWGTSHPEVVTTTGEVDRPAHGADAVVVTLTVTATKGGATASHEYVATVAPLPAEADYEGYFFPYFEGESTPDGESVFFAASDGNDPLQWLELNESEPVLSSELGERGLRDPFLIRSPEGDRFFMIATDLKIYGGNSFANAQERGSRSLMIWESDDLVTWSDQRQVQVSSAFAGNTWAPEAHWDAARGEYIVYWASALYPTTETAGRNYRNSYQRMMYSTTRDFVTFTEPQIWIDEQRGAGLGMIDSSIIEHEGTYYRFTKDESYMGMRLETSTDLRDLDWDFVAERIGFGQPNGYGGTFTAAEGPTGFKSNTEEKWYLFMDQPSYHGGQGYVPFESTDLSTGEWTLAEGAALPTSPRHGTVMPVTAAEHARLLDAFGPEQPAEELDLAVDVAPRCLAGRAYVAVSVTNAEAVPVDVEVVTPYGTRSFAAVAPGKAAYQSFNARATSVPAGSVMVTGTATLDGATITSDQEAPLLATTC